MTPDSTTFLSTPESIEGWVKLIVGIIAILTAGIKAFNWWRKQRDQRKLENGLSADLYSREMIEDALRYYIEPDCQSLDPAGGDEPHKVISTKEPLFKKLDEAFRNPSQYRYIFLLADSGMGKSTFALNYYARNVRQRKRPFVVALLPLGIPDVDKYITEIPDPKNTVLFLDAFDEDTLAIVDYKERLRDLLALTQRFKKVLITCRTQFFPKEEEIPTETGVIKVGPRETGGRHYTFHKMYLSPFTNEQVEAYLKRRFRLWQWETRRKARKLVEKIPNLVIRPMLLARIDDLLESETDIQSTFELYETMVDSWLEREQEQVSGGVDKTALREFSEQMAVDLYRNRKARGAERISREDLLLLAKKWEIPLEDWQLTGRSLLNRDAVGNYKFAHRSIMEFLFVQQFITGNEACKDIPWSDQMQAFLWERLEPYLEMRKQFPFSPAGADLSLYINSVASSELSEIEVAFMIKAHNFFCKEYNWSRKWANEKGKGITHLYEVKMLSGEKVVVDHATGLMWQQSGSENSMNFKSAEKYITDLNNRAFAGYEDWRLPTLKEAMSLMEPEVKNGLFIDEKFDREQSWIWTSDRTSAFLIWVVSFYHGYCGLSLGVFNDYPRAVRSPERQVRH